MFFKNLCILVLWTKEASALEGLETLLTPPRHTAVGHQLSTVVSGNTSPLKMGHEGKHGHRRCLELLLLLSSAAYDCYIRAGQRKYLPRWFPDCYIPQQALLV